MKKLIPLILLTALVGCVDSKDLERRMEVKDRYSKAFEKAFIGNREIDELIMCLDTTLVPAFGCANYILAEDDFELTDIEISDSMFVFYFTRKAGKSN